MLRRRVERASVCAAMWAVVGSLLTSCTGLSVFSAESPGPNGAQDSDAASGDAATSLGSQAPVRGQDQDAATAAATGDAAATTTAAASCGGPLGATTEAPGRCTGSFCSATLPSPGNSLALGDVDGDGRVDMVLGSFGPRLGMLRPVVLLKNRGGMRFDDATAASGLAGVGAWAMSFGDLDADGDLDLVVGGRRAIDSGAQTTDLRIFENDGHGCFVERPWAGGGAIVGAATVVQLVDLNGDRLLDIVLGTGGTDRAGAYRAHAFLADGRGTFAAAPSLLPDDPGFSWTILPTDFNDDSRVDLMVGMDSSAVHEADDFRGQFTCGSGDAPSSLAPVSDWMSYAVAQTGGADPAFARSGLFNDFAAPGSTPMGGVAADFNGDGRLDYFFTQISAQQLFLSQRDGSWRNDGMAAGVATPHGMARVIGWGTAAVDLDRDTRTDLVMAVGTIPISPALQPNRVFMNRPGERFEALPAGNGLDPEGSWGALGAADLDGDGDTDFILGAQGLFASVCVPATTNARIVRNDVDTGARHWLRVRLRGTVSNAEGIGARISASVGGTEVVREVSRGASTMTAGDPEAELGLGPSARVSELVVRWPSGVTQRLRDVAADQVLTVTEPRWLGVDPERPTAGQEVTVHFAPSVVGGNDEGLGAQTSITLRGASWTMPPQGTGSDRVGRFRVGAAGSEVVVTVGGGVNVPHAAMHVRVR